MAQTAWQDSWQGRAESQDQPAARACETETGPFIRDIPCVPDAENFDAVCVHFRWRKLPGKIPGKDELRAKISQLQERVDKKEDSLLEKHLILEEIASLSERLRNQAAEGRQDTLELAQKVRAVHLIHPEHPSLNLHSLQLLRLFSLQTNQAYASLSYRTLKDCN